MTEFGFIDRIKDLFATLPDNGFEGIGDDCAVLPVGGGESLVFTTDMLAEGVHFLRTATSARGLGRKSLAVNLSDVASMGARPIATLLSLSLPDDATGAWAEEFMQGYRELSQEFGVTLAGGDTTRSAAGITINVTAIGRAADTHIKRRSGARPGDVIFTAGALGASGAGLRDILAGRYDTPAAAIHRNPRPQVAEGLWLGRRHEVHAMMDISDGRRTSATSWSVQASAPPSTPSGFRPPQMRTSGPPPAPARTTSFCLRPSAQTRNVSPPTSSPGSAPRSTPSAGSRTAESWSGSKTERSAPSTGTASRITDISATADGKIAPENQQTQKPANRPDKKYSPNESATVRTGHQKPAAENRRPNKPATKPTGNRTDRPAKQTARHITSQPTFRPSTTFRPSAGRNKKNGTRTNPSPSHRPAYHLSAGISSLGSHIAPRQP